MSEWKPDGPVRIGVQYSEDDPQFYAFAMGTDGAQRKVIYCYDDGTMWINTGEDSLDTVHRWAVELKP